jgi:hypothetical protein
MRDKRSLTLREERRLRLFENRVLSIFGLERYEVSGEWRKVRNEELNDLHSSPDNTRVIKSGRMRWRGHVACIGRGEGHTGFWWGDPRRGDHLEGPAVDGRIILKWIFRKWIVGVDWIGWLRIGRGCGLL